MDRSRRGERRETEVPASSRLTVRKKNRRRPTSLWSRLPKPGAIADGCGRALRRGVPAIIATGAVTALGTGLWLGYRFVTTSDRFAIETIEVHGNERLTDDDIRAALPVELGDNVFTADLTAATAQLRAEPWIATADARRVLPDRIVVDVREFHAAVIVELGGTRYLADASGHPFKRLEWGAEGRDNDGAGLPVVTGIARETYTKEPDATARQVVRALDVLRIWRDPARADRPDVGEIHVDDRGLTLISGELAIQVGDGIDWAARLSTFDVVWGALSVDERARARAIHLASRLDHVTVAFAKD